MVILMKFIKIKRKISSTLLRIKELEKFKGKDVEIKLNISETKSVEKEGTNLTGIFSKYADKNKYAQGNEVWALAVKNKHENYRC